MKNYLFLFLLLHSMSLVHGQTQAYIAPFRHDATGAYTLIHDDFGANHARGIEEYIDTMNQRRNLPICFAAITGECDEDDWKKAKEMIAHGHQILNHSMTHKCGQPQSWCTFGNWDEKDFPIEIDKSTELILKHTGKHPAFFVFPFDLFTDTMITYLKAKRYMGSRTGKQSALNKAELLDPFSLNYTVFRPGEAISKLNDMGEQAIQTKSWAIRVMHGIEDDSWGHITAEEYAIHLDYLQRQIQQHKLWMATLSDVVTYQYNKERTALKILEQNNKGQITKLIFETKSMALPQANLLTNNFLTVAIEQTSGTPKSIQQNQQPIPFEVRDGKIIFDANITIKEITLTY